MSYEERTGNPFRDSEYIRLKSFLSEQGLDYDESIEHSIMLEDQGRIIATGSCHGNVIKCVAVSPDYQGQNLLGTIMTHLVAWMFGKGITHYFGFTKPQNKDIFCSMGMYPVAETENVLLLENKRNGLKKYLSQLEKETKKCQETGRENVNGAGIGAVVANCNPFTGGHRYLIEKAAGECRWLHLFILSEEQKFLSTDERMQLVKEGVKDIPNIILHGTSDYLISPAVFPTYFIKDKVHAFTMNCMLDIEIFSKFIAGRLGITKRYVGSEPSCAVTGEYNVCLKRELPARGIDVYEIERKQEAGRPVSASVVRRCYEEGRLDDVRGMVPKTTLDYLKRKSCIVTVAQMAKAREERAARQRKLIEKWKVPVICFMLNIPGAVKTSEDYLWAFREGRKKILNKIQRHGIRALETESIYPVTGYEFYVAADGTADRLKRLMTDMEDSSRLGRLFDVDVIGTDGRKISRSDYGMPARKCILCDQEAHICSRSRNHTVEELLRYIADVIEEARRAD
ncbi:MAG: [citrate (pro-3S)-lyase] ligase [Lachnospiraceae bacterium]|nr:[citrate (pro-3S)-lyase] ligase [Lachnospiraceae bacterium]MDY4969966.1 [citrate (pro-3S)-lyase] ligase [Lachnospiraceae bacterium]